MTYSLTAGVLAIALAAGGSAVAAQQPQGQQPPAQTPQMMGAAPMTGQMGPMTGHMGPMHDPRMHAQMMEMMQGCHRMMSQMQPMPPVNPTRR